MIEEEKYSNNDAAKFLEDRLSYPDTYSGYMLVDWEEVKKMASKALRDIDDCRNELCLKCGKYKEAHLGYCDGCRWKR